MTKLEIRNQIRKNELALAQILDDIKTRKTEATAVETATMNNLKEDNGDLQRQLSEIDKQPLGDATVIEIGVKDEPFSLLRAIRSVAEGRSDYLQHPYLVEGRNKMKNSGVAYSGQIQVPVEEQRAGTGLIVAGTATQGSETIATQKFNLLGALRAYTVFAAAGATFLTGLQSNGSFPIYAGSSAAWATETGATTLGGGTFSKVDYTPHRMTTYIDVSKLFLIQDTVGAEQLLIADIQKAIMVLLEATVLGTAAGDATKPAGVFNTPSYAFTGTTTWAGVVSMESALLTANKVISSNNAAYVIHPSTNGIVKTTAKAANQAIFIREGNSINGYPVYITSNMPTVLSTKKGAIFADWSDLIIAQFGGIDLIVDNFSQAVNGNVRIVVNAYFDAKFRRTVSYALAALA